MEFIEHVKDEEILANSAKVLRIVLRDDKHYDRLTTMHNDMGNLLLDSLQKYSFSDVVLIELLAALRNFTRSPNKVPLVAKTNMGSIIALVVNPPSEKVFTMAVQVLKNFTKIPDYDRHIKQIGGHDVVLAIGGESINKFNFKK